MEIAPVAASPPASPRIVKISVAVKAVAAPANAATTIRRQRAAPPQPKVAREPHSSGTTTRSHQYARKPGT